MASLTIIHTNDMHGRLGAAPAQRLRSLVAQRPDFFTFRTAGLELPEALRAEVLGLPYTHDAIPLMTVAPLVPDAFVDAVTLTGPPAHVAKGVARLVRSGIGQLMVYPVASQGSIIATTISAHISMLRPVPLPSSIDP